ncbi:MerR family transcriptional regulator [Cellulosimicrobium sp. NPDC057127]|uniref:MerR family transcriptional regulator n=1 Tax=Cellulosimicrobium sp. NPDC057127 TaxID=3346026 RepID=UPI0036367EDD
MAWSTRQLAEIAGTTVNTVRHYHQVGLLAEPERAANGYKQYGVPHLVRLLRIRRLAGLGVGLSQIAALDADGTDLFDEIEKIDRNLRVTIEQLERARAEIALVLAHRAPVDVPGGFAELSPHLSDTQRSLLAIYATVFDERTVDALRQVLLRREPTDVELERLPADADEHQVDDLAQRMVPVVRRLDAEFPELSDPLQRSPLGPASAGATLAHALAELYNPAQRQVLQRLDALLGHESGSPRTPAPG